MARPANLYEVPPGQRFALTLRPGVGCYKLRVELAGSVMVVPLDRDLLLRFRDQITAVVENRALET